MILVPLAGFSHIPLLRLYIYIPSIMNGENSRICLLLLLGARNTIISQTYCKHGKIHCTKHLRFQHHEVNAEIILPQCFGQKCILFSVIQKVVEMVSTNTFYQLMVTVQLPSDNSLRITTTINIALNKHCGLYLSCHLDTWNS